MAEGEHDLQYTFAFWHRQGTEDRLALASGIEVILEGDHVVVVVPRGEAELGPADALALGQAAAFAGASATSPELAGFWGWWPPDIGDDPPEGVASYGAPFAFEAGPELWKQFEIEGAPVAEGKDELAYTFGFWHRQGSKR